MIGIMLCVSADIPLDRCQSFLDLAIAESKEQLREMLEAAIYGFGNTDLPVALGTVEHVAVTVLSWPC